MSATLQWAGALSRAEDVRLHRAAFKRSVKVPSKDEGCRLLARELADPSEWLLGVDVEDMLLWPRRMYAVTVRNMLASVGLSPFRKHRLGSLTERQRTELVALLGGQS